MPRFATEAGLKADAVWPASIGALAVLYANIGGGAWGRRSAIAWMMGSWGARLTVQALYARRPEDPPHEDTGTPEGLRYVRLLTSNLRLLTLAVFFSLPALIASRNPEPRLSLIEIVAAGLWVVAFAGESTADRQLLRFTSNGANRGRTCRAGLWKFSRHPNYFFEWLIWIAFALFAAASPWGWVAVGCPVAMLYFLFKVTGIPLNEARALRARGDEYRDYQRSTSVFVPWFPKRC